MYAAKTERDVAWEGGYCANLIYLGLMLQSDGIQWLVSLVSRLLCSDKKNTFAAAQERSLGTRLMSSSICKSSLRT